MKKRGEPECRFSIFSCGCKQSNLSTNFRSAKIVFLLKYCVLILGSDFSIKQDTEKENEEVFVFLADHIMHNQESWKKTQWGDNVAKGPLRCIFVSLQSLVL